MNVKRFAKLTAVALLLMGCIATIGNRPRPDADVTVEQGPSLVIPSSHETEDQNFADGARPIPHVTNAVFETTEGPVGDDGIIRDGQIRLCQAYECGSCGNECSTGQCGCNGNATVSYEAPMGGGFGFQGSGMASGGKSLRGADQNTRGFREPRWRNSGMIPWEEFSYGEYIGPHRTPHVPQYRVRVGDELEFVYVLTRETSNGPYRLFVGDTIQISSATDSSLDQPANSPNGMEVLADGSLSLSLIGQVRAEGKTIKDLQRELNDRYEKYVKNPAIVVNVIAGQTPLRDLQDAVDARAGQGGQSRQATVSPDGTVQLPLIGSVPTIGLTLDEIAREVNARYRLTVRGIEVTPVLLQRADRFIFVVGEVNQPGRYELTGPTSAIQALALAQGFNEGGNLRQIVVLRRDQNWRLVATKLDLAGALFGRAPYPSDEIWLRDSDIVLIPKKPIQRFSETVNQYLANTLYAIFPQQGVAFNFDQFNSL